MSREPGQAIVTKTEPGLVIINTALQYNSEEAAGTGMVNVQTANATVYMINTVLMPPSP
jgi:uncharacterized surface protein with fasciclin (FAS1) repeats